MATDIKVAAWSKKLILGQACAIASGASVPPYLNQVCLWDCFPAKTFLGLPWLLDSAKPSSIAELRIKTLALASKKATPAGALDLPTDFTAKILN